MSEFADLLSQGRIAQLRGKLERKSVDVSGFVAAYLSVLPGGNGESLAPHARTGHVVLVRRLMELFSRIDVLGHGTMAWPQLTSFAAAHAAERASSSESGVSLVYRPSTRMAPDEQAHDLPVAHVKVAKWVPELQLLFIAYEGSFTLHVFNHVTRLIARLHANPPPIDPSVEGAKAEAKAALARARARIAKEAALSAADGAGTLVVPPQLQMSPSGSGGVVGSTEEEGGEEGEEETAALIAQVEAIGKQPAASGRWRMSNFSTWSPPDVKAVDSPTSGRGSPRVGFSGVVAGGGGGESARPGTAPAAMSRGSGSARDAAVDLGPVIARRNARKAAMDSARHVKSISTLSWESTALGQSKGPHLGGPSSPTGGGLLDIASGGAHDEPHKELGGGKVRWAKHVLASKHSVAPGERQRAASILANAYMGAASRTAIVESELGSHVGVGLEGTSLEQRGFVLEETARAVRLGLRFDEAAEANARAIVAAQRSAARSEALCAQVVDLVALRNNEALWRNGFGGERAAVHAALQVHPAGFTVRQAERLAKLTVRDLGSATETLLPIMGVKGKGKVLWEKARRLMSTGPPGDLAVETNAQLIERLTSAAKTGGLGSSTGATLAEVTGGARPNAAFSALMTAFDPGTSGKVRDFGYVAVDIPSFAVHHDSDEEELDTETTGTGGTSGSASRLAHLFTSAKLAESEGRLVTKQQARISRLAKPTSAVREMQVLGIEYCMAVDWSRASKDAQGEYGAWKSLTPMDVSHILVISSSELFLTLWGCKDFEFKSIIHVLLPQNVLAWSSGANLLFTCCSDSGPISGWDVIRSKKIVQLDGHVGPVLSMTDMPSLGLFLTGGHDGRVGLWGYREDTDKSGLGELAGLRGSAPPRHPTLSTWLTGHTGAVAFMAVNDSNIDSILVTATSSGEMCQWDMNVGMLIVKVSANNVNSAGTRCSTVGVVLTATQPPMALTLDDSSNLRMWELGRGGSTTGPGLVLDHFRLRDIAHGGVSDIIVPFPHSHIILAGRRLHILAPVPPGYDEADSVLVSAGEMPPGFQTPLAGVFSAAHACFVTAEGDSLAVHDARSGMRTRTMKGVAPATIVSLAMEPMSGSALWASGKANKEGKDYSHPAGRRCFVADTAGNVRLVSVIDGRVIVRATNAHKNDVTRIIPVPEDYLVLTASWDRSLRVFDYGPSRHHSSATQKNGAGAGGISAIDAGGGSSLDSEMPCIRLIENAHSSDITCMDASRPLGLVATGAADGTLRVWDFSSFELISELFAHKSGVTAVAFASPAPVPLLVSADSGGFIYLWAVRGSRYIDRLLLGVVNMGRSIGPPPPSVRVVNINALRSVAARKSTTIIKDGITTAIDYRNSEYDCMTDPDLSSLFKARLSKSEHVARQEALKSVLEQEVDMSRAGVAYTQRAVTAHAESLAATIASSRSNGLGSPRAGVAAAAAATTVVSAPPPSSVPPLFGTPSGGILPPTSATSERAYTDVPVPVTCLAVYCTPLHSDDAEYQPRVGAVAADADEASSPSFPIKLCFKIFSADAQGAIKHWDISQHVARFMASASSGIGILKPDRRAPSLSSYNPHASKHRVYPNTTVQHADPEREARRVADAIMAKRISAISSTAFVNSDSSDALSANSTDKNASSASQDVARSVATLARLRLQRQLYTSSGSAQPPGAAAVTAVSASPRAAAVLPSARASSASGLLRKGSAATSGGGAGIGSGVGDYPKVDPFLGAVVYAKFNYKARSLPLLALFATPSLNFTSTTRLNPTNGMNVVGLTDEDFQLSAPSAADTAAIASLLSPAAAGARGNSGMGGGSPARRAFARVQRDSNTGVAAVDGSTTLPSQLASGASVVMDRSVAAMNSTAAGGMQECGGGGGSSFYPLEELPRAVQDELWYNFRISAASSEAIASNAFARSQLAAAADARAAQLGFPEEVGDASVAAAARGAVKRNFIVPTDAWAKSRLRLDIAPVSTWTAHTDLVTSITMCFEPMTLLSCSLDGSARLWKPNGLPVGVISCVPQPRTPHTDVSTLSPGAAAPAPHVPTLNKDTCPWQFVPNDSEDISASIILAERVFDSLAKAHFEPPTLLGRIVAPRRRGSMSGSSVSSEMSGHSNQGIARHTAVQRRSSTTHADVALANLLAHGSAASKDAVNKAMALDTSMAIAERDTSIGEAIIVEGESKTRERRNSVSKLIPGATPSIEPGRLHVDEIDDVHAAAASQALNVALIRTFETWDDDVSDHEDDEDFNPLRGTHHYVGSRRNSDSSTGSKTHNAALLKAELHTEHGVGEASFAAQLAADLGKMPGAPAEVRGLAAAAEAAELAEAEAAILRPCVTLLTSPQMNRTRVGGLSAIEKAVTEKVISRHAAALAFAEAEKSLRRKYPNLLVEGALAQARSDLKRDRVHGVSRTDAEAMGLMAAGATSSPSDVNNTSTFNNTGGFPATPASPFPRLGSSDDEAGGDLSPSMPAPPFQLQPPPPLMSSFASPPPAAGSSRPASAMHPPHTAPSIAFAAARPHTSQATTRPGTSRVTTSRMTSQLAARPGTTLSTARPGMSPAFTQRPTTSGSLGFGAARPGTASSVYSSESLSGAARPTTPGGGLVSRLRLSASAAAAEARLDGLVNIDTHTLLEEWPDAPPMSPLSPSHYGDASDDALRGDATPRPQTATLSTVAPGDRMQTVMVLTAGVLANQRIAPVVPVQRRRMEDVFIKAPREERRSAAAATAESPARRTTSVPAASPMLSIQTIGFAGSAPHVARNLAVRTSPRAAAAAASSAAPSALLEAAAAASSAAAEARAAGTGNERRVAVSRISSHRVPDGDKVFPRRSAPPFSLSRTESIMWPWQGYEPPRRFGVYTPAEVFKFRRDWMHLDVDKSGMVDVEELLNSGMFTSQGVRLTKSIFASVDTDHSGEISKRELLRVVFPLVSMEVREEIARYTRWLDAGDEVLAEEARMAKAVAEEASRENRLASGTGEFASPHHVS